MNPSTEVTLVDVDRAVADRLLQLAKRDASPDEVAPPLDGPGWNLERTAWFYSYHQAAAGGLDGPAAEKSWAVFSGSLIAGSVRLKRETSSGTPSGETGIWLGRSFRSRGIGAAALDLVLAEARRAGLKRVSARTLAGNAVAQRLLAAAGAALTHHADGTVLAVVEL
ncbi:GNAT family N-acetyltransferase [Pseudarthrobacter sp. BRE9]|uniref:GNAT family N-acetyltransferase n=1 Tax=Pseudarthrobacter sp. BRE9 TaxID=2962582 RepID=UPI002880CFBA|nr:GNAT family N-acetyltransferase [Pseudarthrobacter sp. BRE9]MDT0168572.1 GNAT family N-acetyltransferase [Pseudarthrobacter sp. BRE9]